ncbi:uncharacterized protein DS421_19g659790 [Arachis hypogaea]|uniref:Aminotransferase-like plant mobile domain-containing protein n=1 Tax=Arachis hypogaea TaxID=3818 RepID=A0A6B9VBB0_ARAHY|nr:uncharacterized protein DS421_19g659790 [Arachis hypogaea]
MSSLMLTCDHPVPPDRYNDRKVLINALVERWHPDTHTFHLPVGECAVTLEDVAVILGLLTDGLPVIGMTMSSFKALEAECLHQFGVSPRKSDYRGSCIKLTWLRDLKERLQLTNENNMQRYVKCHIMLLFDMILFGDNIRQYSWGSACLANLYRALCRASHFDCKEIDDLLTLLLNWAWIRLPYLAPVPRESCSFSLANRWRNWECGDRCYRYLTLAHFKKALDDLQEGHVYIYMHSVVSSVTVLLVSFECIEWHATDRFRRQFGFVKGVSHQEQNLDKAHGEVLIENDESNQVMDDDNQEQEPQSPPPPPPQEQSQSSSQYVPQTQCRQAQYGHQPDFMVVGIPWTRGIHAALPWVLLEENSKTLEQETDEYLVDKPDDREDEDKDMDEDEESRIDAFDDGDDESPIIALPIVEAHTPDETGKGYNLRVDPSCHSAN